MSDSASPRRVAEYQYQLIRAECDAASRRHVEEVASKIMARLDADDQRKSATMKAIEDRVRATETSLSEIMASVNTAKWTYGSLLALVGTAIGIVALAK